MGGGNSPPGEKGPGSTGSMLRSTLRKMTRYFFKLCSVLCPCARFSIGGKKKDDEEGGESSEPDQKQSRSRNPFLGKSRVPQSQSPGPGVRSQLLESSLILPVCVRSEEAGASKSLKQWLEEEFQDPRPETRSTPHLSGVC